MEQITIDPTSPLWSAALSLHPERVSGAKFADPPVVGWDTPVPPTTSPSLIAGLARAVDQAHMCHKLLSELNEKIAPILTPEGPDQCGSAPMGYPYQAPANDAVSSLTEILEVLAGRLITTAKRAEI